MHISLTQENRDTLRALLEYGAQRPPVLGVPSQKLLDKLTAAENDLTDPRAQAYIKAARENYHADGELEFDDETMVSMGSDEGAYVMAWKWIENGEAGLAAPDEDDTPAVPV